MSIDEMEKDIALLKERQSLHIDGLDKISKILLGNGKAGIISMVLELHRDMKVIKWISTGLFMALAGIFITLAVNTLLLHGVDLLR